MSATQHPQCAVDGCAKPGPRRGWCGAHYEKWRRGGNVGGVQRERETCTATNCAKPAQTKELCNAHYKRTLKGVPVNAPLTERTPNQGRDCSLENCGKPARMRGWCSAHYEHWRRGLADYGPERIAPACEADGCSAIGSITGLCPMHHQRWRKFGSLELPAAPVFPKPTVLYPRPAPETVDGCAVNGCDTDVHKKGMCRRHYVTWFKHGDPLWEVA